MPSPGPSRFMLKVYVAACVAVVAFLFFGTFSMVLQPQDSQDGFAGSPLLTEVAPLGGMYPDQSRPMVDQLDRFPVVEIVPHLTVRWRAPSEYSKPEDSTEVLVLRALMRRLSQLQESPAASDTKARALFKLMEAEQVLLGDELRGDMPSFPGIK